VIAFLTGALVHKSPTFALLEVGGVGFRLNMTTRSLDALPAEGDEVTVQTHLHVREDEISLFGFESLAEKAAFEQLLTVSGVGTKVALAALSSLSPDELANAVAGQDVGVISGVPGIGKKTAQRIILDLADKLCTPDAEHFAATIGKDSAAVEARDALLAMGFTAIEAATALKGGSGDARAHLRHALQRLGRAG